LSGSADSIGITKLVISLLTIFVLSYLRYFVFLPVTPVQQFAFTLSLIFLYKFSSFPVTNRKNWVIHFLRSVFLSYVLNACFFIFLFLLAFIHFPILVVLLIVIIYIGLDFLSNFYLIRSINHYLQLAILIFSTIVIYFASVKLHEIVIAQLFEGTSYEMGVFYELFLITLSVIFAPVLTILYLRENKNARNHS